MLNNVKPRLLIFYDYFSPAYKAGGPIRSLVNMTTLLQEDLDIYVFTASVDLDGTSLAVEEDSWQKFNENIKVFYASKSKRKVSFIHQTIKNVKPDIIYINGLFTPYSVLFPLLALKFGLGLKRPRLVLASRGMLKESALALKAGKKKLYLKLFKLLGLHKKIAWHATDPQEEKNIRLFAEKGSEVQLIGNVPVLPDATIKNKKSAGTLRIVSVSLIAKTKNLLFLLKVLQGLKQEFTIYYDIFGPVKDKDYFQLIEKEIQNSPSSIHVTYKGALQPEQVPSILQNYDCFVLPTLGENFGHAIFEALGAALPVLISDQTPWKGLENEKAGWDLPLQEAPWIEKLAEIAKMKEEEFQQWREGAYSYAVAHLKKENLKEHYLGLFGIK